MHIFLSEERIRKINQNIRLIYNEATSEFMYLKKNCISNLSDPNVIFYVFPKVNIKKSICLIFVTS